MLVVLAVLAAGVDPRCQSILDGWCNGYVACQNTMDESGAPVELFARYSTGHNDDTDKWRCYAGSALSPDKSHYVSGGDYCTTGELEAQLGSCQATNTTFVEVFTPFEEDYPCTRIPAIVTIPTTGRLVAFAECRNWTGDGCIPTVPARLRNTTINYNKNRDLCAKTSDDGGRTWTRMNVIARASMEPTPVWSHARQTLILQYNDLEARVYQMQTTDGVNWSQNISIPVPQAAVGPGPGLELASGRLLFLGHVGSYAYDLVWYSVNEEGTEYKVAQTQTALAGQNEASATQLPSGTIVANMRNRDKRRGVSYSHDEGVTWTPVQLMEDLPDPTNQGTIITLKTGQVAFANSANTTARATGLLRIGSEMHSNGTIQWNTEIPVWPEAFGYSCLTVVPKATQVGLLWESKGPQCSGDGVSCRTLYSVYDV